MSKQITLGNSAPWRVLATPRPLLRSAAPASWRHLFHQSLQPLVLLSEPEGCYCPFGSKLLKAAVAASESLCPPEFQTVGKSRPMRPKATPGVSELRPLFGLNQYHPRRGDWPDTSHIIAVGHGQEQLSSDNYDKAFSR